MLPLIGLMAATAGASSPAVFTEYLKADVPPADGFDYPVGDRDARGAYVDPRSGRTHRGWYVATKFGESYRLGIHPGEDWNGRGGGNTDLGQPVRAIGRGRVVHARFEAAPWGGVVMVEHVFYENHDRQHIVSMYAHLSKINVKVGDIVQRRQQIGAIGRDPDRTFPAHLHFEIRRDRTLSATYWPSSNGHDLAWIETRYLFPSRFIRTHRTLFVPSEEPVLVLIDERSHQMARYERGRRTDLVEVGFGQKPGRKRVQGDLKTPKGMYFVVHKYRGEFTGRYGDYYGGHWIKLNYPNAYDAQWGLESGRINAKTAAKIAARWRKRKLTSQKTKLGGGIGFHGWAGRWRIEDGGRLSWGCVVMHNPDIKRLFETIPVGAMVVIF